MNEAENEPIVLAELGVTPSSESSKKSLVQMFPQSWVRFTGEKTAQYENSDPVAMPGVFLCKMQTEISSDAEELPDVVELSGVVDNALQSLKNKGDLNVYIESSDVRAELRIFVFCVYQGNQFGLILTRRNIDSLRYFNGGKLAFKLYFLPSGAFPDFISQYSTPPDKLPDDGFPIPEKK